MIARVTRVDDGSNDSTTVEVDIIDETKTPELFVTKLQLHFPNGTSNSIARETIVQEAKKKLRDRRENERLQNALMGQDIQVT